jgi:hypothetical protein
MGSILIAGQRSGASLLKARLRQPEGAARAKLQGLL